MALDILCCRGMELLSMDKYVGKRLDGRYEIMGIIGVGGMAVVYKARDIIDDRIVAVKILKDEFHNNEEFRRRFKNECKAIAVLSHPNIVKIYDVSFGDRLEYIVMEYIEGITLKDYIKQQGQVKWSEVVHFTLQILRALQHAHDKGIIHRDIKSQNIMLLQNGTIKVTDFGIARFNRLEPHEDNNGKTIGSVHYISPEQARGDMVDERSDIYSTGIIMYEMLTGRLPFDGSNAVSVAIKQLESEPPAPRQINPSIPEGLEEITLKAMKKDVSQRYQSAAEMIADIEKFKNNPSIRFEYKYFVDETPTKFVQTVTPPVPRKSIDDKQLDKKSKKAKTKYVYYDDDEFDEPKRKSFLPLLAGVIAAFLIFGTVCVVFIDELTGIFTQTSNTIDVPKLVGMDLKEANDSYRDVLVINVINQQSSSEYAEGVIIEQSRSEGQKVPKLSTIDVVTSKGSKGGQNVPDVYGLSKNDAKKAIEDAGFEYQEITMGDNDTPENCVIKTDPERNMSLEPGQRVLVYISSGPVNSPVKVPPVIGLSEQDAKTLLEQSGLKYGTPLKKDSNKPAGEVIECAPEVGETVDEGSTVTLIVSNGNLAEKNISIDIPLPNASVDVYLKIYKNDELVEQTSALNTSQGTYTSNITGSGEGTVRVTISAYPDTGYNDYILYNVNFATGNITKTNSYNFQEPNMEG